MPWQELCDAFEVIGFAEDEATLLAQALSACQVRRLRRDEEASAISALAGRGVAVARQGEKFVVDREEVRLAVAEATGLALAALNGAHALVRHRLRGGVLRGAG